MTDRKMITRKNRSPFVHMRESADGKPKGMRYELLHDGVSCGGSVSREGILTVLLGTIRQRRGTFEVIDRYYPEDDPLLIYKTDAKVWDDDAPKLHPMEPRHGWKPAMFYAGDEIDPEYCFAGYHRGNTWNGWAMPAFEREEVDRIVAMVEESETFDWNYHQGYRFTWVRDVLVVEDANAEATYAFEPMHERTEDGERILYALFSGNWTWDILDDDYFEEVLDA